MMHKWYITNLLIIVSLLCISNISSSVDILDVSDFRFYYKTYNYMLDSSQYKTTTFYNDELQVNITIDLSSQYETITLILHDTNNNMIELNALNDSDWDEISNIQDGISLSSSPGARSLLSGCAGSCYRRAARLERARARIRARNTKARKRRMRMRAKWRERVKRIRRRKDTKLKLALRKLKRKELQAGTDQGWIADILQRKIRFMEDRRRIMIHNTYDNDNDNDNDIVLGHVVSRCKVIKNVLKYEICLHYYVDDEMFLSFEIKLGEKKVFKKADVSYRDLIHLTQELFIDDGDGEWLFNPIEGNLGDMINTYELMDWHSFNFNLTHYKQYEYGEFDGFNDYIRYFDEYELDVEKDMNDINDMYIECSEFIDDLPFKMCMKIVNMDGKGFDTFLYFEKDINYKDEILYIDDAFKNNIFSFSNNDNWDEIHDISLMEEEEDNNVNWIKKCSHKLIIAQICVQQFDAKYHTASIKFKTKDIKRN